MNPLLLTDIAREHNLDLVRIAEKRRLEAHAARMPKTDRRARFSWLHRRSDRPAIVQ
jgi:hypothetical protein